MMVKCYGYNSVKHGMDFAQDLKLGQYMVRYLDIHIKRERRRRKKRKRKEKMKKEKTYPGSEGIWFSLFSRA
jgi:hypothetical protein